MVRVSIVVQPNLLYCFSFYMKELVLCLKTLANTQWELWMISIVQELHHHTTSGRKARQQGPEGPERRPLAVATT